MAAQAYNGETDVYEAMCSILNKMSEYIECRNGIYWIENPVMKEENFADKWNDSPNKRIAFFRWLEQAKKELIEEPLSSLGLNNVAENYKNCLGKAPVERALKMLGTETKNARQEGSLYINGLTGGLTTLAIKGSKQIKGHTFFGK